MTKSISSDSYKEKIRLNVSNACQPLGMRLIMSAIICLSAISLAAGGMVSVRLTNGPSKYEGRLEVYYNGSWGTVCNDNFDKSGDENCAVVCSQLGYSGGRWRDDAAIYYGQGADGTRIWLDDVNCSGTELNIDACLHAHWGHTDCTHEEDTGCQCDAPTDVYLPGSCDSSRHRIWPFDPRYPGIGRAEVQAGDGKWYAICDDYWDDVDAAVFCTCLGYTDRKHFRSYISPDLYSMTELPMLYDSVECSTTDTKTIRNIWQCKTSPDTGLCNPATEAAGIACQGLPVISPPAPPKAHLECNGEELNVCYTSVDYELLPKYLNTDPLCAYTSISTVEDGICINIPLHHCDSPHTTSDVSTIEYCYDVGYTEPTGLSGHNIVLGNTWVRSACCALAKNGTVFSSFLPHVPEQAKVHGSTSVNFSIDCYRDDDFTGEPLEFPINITRGEAMYCVVNVDTENPNLRLIVPDCRFMARKTGSPSFKFIDDKCETTTEFGIDYVGSTSHTWGFKFLTPQFQGYNELYLSCDCYVCDSRREVKPYCDRSCHSRTRTKRSTSGSYPRSGDEIRSGTIYVDDSSSGPLINQHGWLYNGGQNVEAETEKESQPFVPWRNTERVALAGSVGRMVCGAVVMVGLLLSLIPYL